MSGAAFRFFDSQQPLYGELQNQIPITPVETLIPGNVKGQVFGLFLRPTTSTCKTARTAGASKSTPA